MIGSLRLRLLQLGALMVLVVLGGQLLRMQILDPSMLFAQSGGQVRVLEVEPPRGLIYDRNGVLIAKNTPAFALRLVPGDLPRNAEQRRAVLMALERATGVSYAAIERAVGFGEAGPDAFAPVTIQGGLDLERAIMLRAATAGLPGVTVEAKPVREYEGGELLAHILGHVGAISADTIEAYLAAGYPMNADVGQHGVELRYEANLRGEPGRRLVLAEPSGRELQELGLLGATPGADVVLSIDMDLQRVAAEALERGIFRALPVRRPDAGPERPNPIAAGAAVVIDVRTGELLSLVSYPSYDANLFTSGDVEELERVLTDPARPLVNRTFMEAQPPGSIFKALTGLAALEEGVSTPGTLITSTGSLVVYDEYNPGASYIFRDWAAHGTLDLYGAMARSSNVYFFWLAGGYRSGGRQVFEGMGADALATWARHAGLGRETGIDLPAEAPGLIPDPEWKEETLEEQWVLGDTYNMAIGQGAVTTSPLQMAVFAAAIANGGDLLVPRVVRGLQHGQFLEVFQPRISGRLPASAETLRVIREAMRHAASPAGTAATGKPPGIDIGGKTGTAEFGMPYPNFTYDTHGWYMAFAPYDEPEIAVVVYLEHGVGATDAGPVAREIFQAYFDLKDRPATAEVDPDADDDDDAASGDGAAGESRP